MHRRLAILTWFAAVLLTTACNPNASPDQIRDRTARDTATLKRDSKAVAEGIKEGLSSKRSLDLNRASKQDLAALPGMDEHKAERVIAERPYAAPHQLVTRHILTEDEFSRIHDQVTATP